MLILVLNINLGIANFSSLNIEFTNSSQDSIALPVNLLSIKESNLDSGYEDTALRAIDSNSYLTKHNYLQKLAAKYPNLEDELLKIQKKAKRNGIRDTLLKGKLELLQIYGWYNYEMSMADI